MRLAFDLPDLLGFNAAHAQVMPYTINYKEGNQNFNAHLAEPDGTAGGMYGYSAPVWTMMPDPSPAVALNPSGDVAGDLQLIVKGVPGVVNITATFTRVGSPTIAVTETVTVVGPVPDHAVINLVPLTPPLE